jgi:hypothetical protein
VSLDVANKLLTRAVLPVCAPVAILFSAPAIALPDASVRDGGPAGIVERNCTHVRQARPWSSRLHRPHRVADGKAKPAWTAAGVSAALGGIRGLGAFGGVVNGYAGAVRLALQYPLFCRCSIRNP